MLSEKDNEMAESLTGQVPKLLHGRAYATRMGHGRGRMRQRAGNHGISLTGLWRCDFIRGVRFETRFEQLGATGGAKAWLASFTRLSPA